MNNCEIQIKNGFPVVKTYPKLMQEILTYTGFDTNQALDLYGVTLLDEFKDLGLKKPGLNNVLSFIEQDHIDSSYLNKSDKQKLLDVFTRPDEIENIKEAFLNSFTIDGKFEINADNILQQGLFTQSDILDFENNLESVRDLYYKVQNSSENFETVLNKYAIKNDSLSKQNPDKFVQNIQDNYIGLKTEDEIWDRAVEVGDSVIQNNPTLIPMVLEDIQGKQNLVQYETDEFSGELVKKTRNNPLIELEQTIDMNQDYSEFMTRLQYAMEFPALDLDLISDLEKYGISLGINIVGLTDLITSKSQDESYDFLGSLYNMIYDVQIQNSNLEETLQEYAQVYAEYFQVSPEFTNKTIPAIKNEGIYLHLETNQSEEEIFVNNGLIKIQNNIYQKIQNSDSLEDLYNLLFENYEILPKDIYSVDIKKSNKDFILEDIDKYVSNQALNYLTENSDIENLKKMVVYKILTLNNYSKDQKVFNGNLNLDVDNFLISFNKQLLKNPEIQDLFYYSNRGLEAKYVMSEYTVKQLQNNLPQATFSNLVKYAKLSGNESLEYLTTLENDIQPENQRDFYANNLEELPVFNSEYYRKDGYVVADSNEDFIRVKNELYEMVEPNVYAKVQRNTRYTNYGLSKPDYNGSITPDIKSQEGGNIQVKKTKEINNNTIEFC